MPNPSRRLRILSILLLTLGLFVTSSAWAAGGPAGRSTPGLLSRAWSFLVALWTKEGCNVDPDGRCFTAPAPVPAGEQVDTGCNVDPNGAKADTGCSIDPDGRCVTSPPEVRLIQGDEGCHIDPNGHCRS